MALQEKKMPKEEGIDHTLSLLKEGYRYILNRSQSFQSNIFETRLMGKRVICLIGADAAELFYDPTKFQRQNAAPNRLVQTLFGQNGVQTLDGDAHRHRKEMFMSLMSEDNHNRFIQILQSEWDAAIERWTKMEQIIFYEEVQEILCRAACEWSGVPLKNKNVKELASKLSAMYESPAKAGPEHWAGRHARNQVEALLRDEIQQIREDTSQHPTENTILSKIALYRDLDGNLLDSHIASVELVNILRPIVAVSIYINFILLSLHHYPDEKKKLLEGNENEADCFIQEVRRFYPFFPFVAAIVKKDFSWNGYPFNKGTLTLLDLFGTNHHPESWENPDTFHPERFNHLENSMFHFIPQGGGDYDTGHRCAGEEITITIMKIALDYLVNKMEYELPNQDYSYRLNEIPSIPTSKIVLSNVKWRS